jgi:hypothetical protein
VRTSLTAKLVAVSLNRNRTTCVVYGTSGAWLPKRYPDHCTIELEKMKRPATQSANVRAPKAFLGISISLDRGSLFLRNNEWVARSSWGDRRGTGNCALRLLLTFDAHTTVTKTASTLSRSFVLISQPYSSRSREKVSANLKSPRSGEWP